MNKIAYAPQVGTYVQMPARYDPADVTWEACRQDPALRVVTDEYGQPLPTLDETTRAMLATVMGQRKET